MSFTCDGFNEVWGRRVEDWMGLKQVVSKKRGLPQKLGENLTRLRKFSKEGINGSIIFFLLWFT